MNGFEVDARALADITGRLRGASDRLDALSGTIPAAPADGPGAPLVAQMLAELVGRSAEITVGLRAASEVATACLDDYCAADRSLAGPS